MNINNLNYWLSKQLTSIAIVSEDPRDRANQALLFGVG